MFRHQFDESGARVMEIHRLAKGRHSVSPDIPQEPIPILHQQFMQQLIRTFDGHHQKHGVVEIEVFHRVVLRAFDVQREIINDPTMGGGGGSRTSSSQRRCLANQRGRCQRIDDRIQGHGGQNDVVFFGLFIVQARGNDATQAFVDMEGDLDIVLVIDRGRHQRAFPIG